MKVIVIGRHPNCDVVLEDPMVERQHIQIVQKEDGKCSVVDLQTTNGTYVNGARISHEVPLQPNDTIRIGNTNIPWQEYVNRASSNSSKIIVLVSAGVVLFLMLVGFVAYMGYKYLPFVKSDETITSLPDSSSVVEDEKIDYYVKGLEEQVIKDKEQKNNLKKEVDKSHKEATDAKNNAQKAEAALKKAEKEINSAISAKAQAEKEKSVVEEQKKKAEDEVKKVQSNITAANKERDYAKKESELKTAFYTEYVNLSQKEAQQVCQSLNKKPSKEDANKVLHDIFNAANNTDKAKVIDVIKSVKTSSKTVESGKSVKKLSSKENVTDSVVVIQK